MTKRFFMYFAFALCTSLTQCSKTTVDPNGLPPETQTGAGTFACLINGAVWQYKNADNFFTTPKTRWEFDPSMYGGYLSIGGIRYSDGVNADAILSLVADSLLTNKEKTVNKYYGIDYGINYINYSSTNRICREFYTTPVIDSSKNFYSSGKFTLTKLDQNARIIAGTFYCTIYQTGCDTLKITEGRFDLKYQ